MILRRFILLPLRACIEASETYNPNGVAPDWAPSKERASTFEERGL
jgi:hypothetical protein